MLHDSAWVLPMTSRSMEQFQWLATEITALGGDALIWEARLTVNEQNEELMRTLLAEVKPSREETPTKAD